MKSLLKGLAPLVLFLLTCSDQAVADPVVIDPLWKVTVTNNTGVTVFGVHLNFTGTDGTMEITAMMNPPEAGGAVVGVSSDGSGIDILWNTPPGLPAGSTFMVQFTTDVPDDVMFNDGFWIINPPFPPEVDPKRDKVTVQEIPEPVTLVLFASGLIGVALKSRKKL